VTDVAIDGQEGFRKREFRRFLVGSLLFHLAIFVVLVIDFGGKVAVPRGVVSVNLVSLPAPAPPKAAPRPKPAEAKPKPVPPPPPKAPVQEKIVLPKESRVPPPKPAQEKVKPKPAPAPVRKELTPEDLARPQEQDYDDVMAQLRSESAETFPEAETVEKPPPMPAGSPTGTGRPLTAEESVWMRKAKIHVRKNWTLTAGFRTQPLETHVSVELDAGGALIGEPRIVRGSGNPWYDDSVLRALEKSSPLPPPPASGDWSFVFVPDDSY